MRYDSFVEDGPTEIKWLHIDRAAGRRDAIGNDTDFGSPLLNAPRHSKIGRLDCGSRGHCHCGMIEGPAVRDFTARDMTYANQRVISSRRCIVAVAYGLR